MPKRERIKEDSADKIDKSKYKIIRRGVWYYGYPKEAYLQANRESWAKYKDDYKKTRQEKRAKEYAEEHREELMKELEKDGKI